MLLHAQGDYVASQRHLEQALAIRAQVLGPNHPDTANSLGSLGMLFYDQGNYQEAAALMRQALAIYETGLGPQHPDTKRSRQSLANIEQRLGEDKAS